MQRDETLFADAASSLTCQDVVDWVVGTISDRLHLTVYFKYLFIRIQIVKLNMYTHFTIFIFYFAASSSVPFAHFYPLSLISFSSIKKARHAADVFVFLSYFLHLSVCVSQTHTHDAYPTLFSSC